MTDIKALIAYRGKDRNGTALGGLTTDSPADLIGRLFREKWLWATAERDGIDVGGIGFNVETGQRVWWAEGATPPPAENALAKTEADR